jgi:hypothetical protein
MYSDLILNYAYKYIMYLTFFIIAEYRLKRGW